MIDINLYKDVFDKYTFDIHEAVEGKRLGLLKHLIYDINEKFPYDNDIKYITSLGYSIECRFVKSSENINIFIFKEGICDFRLNNITCSEIRKLLELEKKYY